MAELTNEEFYEKWVPLLADNVFQDINGSRFEELLADMRDSFASMASQNAQPVAPAVNFDPVLRQLTATHLLGTAELEYNQHNGGFTAYQPLTIDDLGHAQGEWRFRVRADTGRNPSQTTDSPEIIAKGTTNPAGPGKIKVADISDATEAGRALLLAKDVAAQRTLLDKLNLIAGQYGVGQPKFDTLFGDDGALAYILRRLGTQAAPAAPTAGQVDDTADTFSFLPNPLFPSFSQYKVAGLPGVTGAVALDNANSYVLGSRIVVKVVGAVVKGGLAVYVAGSGNVPDGQVLPNADPFTGAIVVTPPTTTPALTAALAISVASTVAGSPLTFEVTAGGGTAPYAYVVKATNNATGAVAVLGSSAAGSFTPQAGGVSYNIDATVTDAAGKVAQATTRTVQVTSPQSVNQLPVANAGDDLIITLPTSSAALMGIASDPDAGDSLTYLWRQITGPAGAGTATGLPATSLNAVVSNLAAGTYQFGFQATDSKGGKSTEDFVVVTVNAAPAPVNATKIYWAAIGNSIDTPGGSDIADPVYIVSAYQQLGSPANLELHHYGYPGKTLQWIVTNRLTTILSEIQTARNSGQYTKCVVTLHEGENGLFVYDADTAYNTAFSVCGQLKQLATGSFPVQIGLVPVVNRVSGAGLPYDYNGRRTTLNNRLRSTYASYADFFVEPENQLSVWGDNYPLNYPNTYCSDGTHPNTEGSRIMGVELAQTMRPFVGVSSIFPTYVKNIGYTPPATGGGGGTTPVAQIDPESRAYAFAPMIGSGVTIAADNSSVQQGGVSGGDFQYTAVSRQVAQIKDGQRWVSDHEFTLLTASNIHVVGLIQATTAGNDGAIEVRIYPEGNGHTRIWINVVGGSTLVHETNLSVADGDKYLFRTYTNVIEVYQNGTLLKAITRATGDTRFFHAAIAFGNAAPGDTIVVMQRGVQLVTG